MQNINKQIYKKHRNLGKKKKRQEKNWAKEQPRA